jgi:hypothetical protein
VIREEFGPLLDGTDLSLLAVIGGTGIGRVTVTPEGATLGAPLEPLDIETPVFDIVTTQAYPRYARNPPGLSIEGRKTWVPDKSLEQFFKTRLGIAPRDYATMVERLCESAVEVGRELIDAARNEAAIWTQRASSWLLS